MTPAALVAALLALASLYRAEIRRAEASESGADEAFAAELAAMREALTVRLPARTPCGECGRPPGPLSLFTTPAEEA